MTVLDAPLMDAMLDVLAHDAAEDQGDAFRFRPGWWTWEHEGAVWDGPDAPTLSWARRRLNR